MSNSASNIPSGESMQVELDEKQKQFINDEARRLDTIKDNDLLKHFTETWWNLCQWEKQRLDILDTKAQMLLGLSGLATAILGTGFAEQSHLLRAIAAVGFLLTMAGALIALRVRNVGGFIDREVFGALSAATIRVGETPSFTDKDPIRCYYREIALQRWLVYDLYKKACATKSSWVKRAQFIAAAAIILAAMGVVAPPAQTQTQTQSPTPASAGTAPASSPAPAPASTTGPSLGSTAVSSAASVSVPASSLTPASTTSAQLARP
ncbi:hypothetical protein AB4Y45_22875 [Paraburkholderia sp. EG287A]|uniref:hypothetical protein n=1 Tax=Paraburkholderia sp. EG287A TaxID=3237012 RepID=UPI0034D21433